jgi:hypothetical protein
MFSHSFLITVNSSRLFLGLGLCALTLLSNSSHKFSIGFKSGLWAGHERLLIELFAFQIFVEFAA